MDKNKIEEYVKKLTELESQINDNGVLNDGDEEDFMKQLELVFNELSGNIEKEMVVNSHLVSLKYINLSNNPDPEFAKEGDSGFDLRANLLEPEIIYTGQAKMIPTGLFFEVSKGYEIQVRSRSGLAGKNSVMVLNSPGTVDSGYRGEILIILMNFSPSPFIVNHGDRIAQGVVCPVFGEGNLNLIKVKKLSETSRNTGGFGHTGKV